MTKYSQYIYGAYTLCPWTQHMPWLSETRTNTYFLIYTKKKTSTNGFNQH